MQTQLARDLGLEFPIFAFSHCRDVVAAVSRAGGMGVLGALYFTPEELEMELKWIDDHVDGKPYGVDLVMPAKAVELPGGHERRRDREPAGRHDLAGAPRVGREGAGRAQRSAAARRRRAQPPTARLDRRDRAAADRNRVQPLAQAARERARAAARRTSSTRATSAACSSPRSRAARGTRRSTATIGVDIVVAQGTEAGGHTGEISSVVLWPQVIDTVGPEGAVLAAGGIAHGSQIAAALAMGAQGVWTGSIWLTVAESDMTPLVLEKLMEADSTQTVRSRALSGKPARQLKTEWTEAWNRDDCPGYLPMPLQYMLVSDVMARVARASNRELTGMPVGQVVGMMNDVRPVRDVMQQLVEEYIEASDRLSALNG